ncbi:MAG: glucosaminidase domain-containing protein [Proteobacteria bacterium]|nr:glucosaminidase domain-containing protein [Pseudomonadota bacterium]
MFAGVGAWFATSSSFPDFASLEAGSERKAAFLDYLRPIVEAENAVIGEDRQRLQSILRDGPGWFDQRWLNDLATRYSVEPDDVDTLQLRVDTVPVSLALAQAAKESGWGSSRFATEVFNLYGERCFNPGCGVVPRKRRPGAEWEVASFPSPQASVRSYFYNINTHDRYRNLRLKRARLRATKAKPSGFELASGLQAYSTRGQAYVEDIRGLIRSNKLE